MGERVAAHEILVGTNAVRNLIRENQLAQIYSMIQTGARYGMQTMEDSVNDLVLAGPITETTAHNALKDSTEDMGESGAPVVDAPELEKPGAKPGKAGPARVSPPITGSNDGGYSF